ncbi:MAG: nitrate reductase molybdenum cofactor assembly chaperone [Clostridia bacterium]|nr:nitrate reductase molybdenum cofactor assembly chaperone [Clostridia bacterium]
MEKIPRELYQLFSEVLEYPTPNLEEKVNECIAITASVNSKAAARLEKFKGFVAQTPPGRLEEIYSGTFDLQPTSYPYAGYHLFGENYKRGAFMVKLQEQYKEHGFSAENELPDHIAVILRFLSTTQDDENTSILLKECLIPVLTRLTKAFGEQDQNYYGEAIKAILLVLTQESGVSSQ